jgi:hypothetical protein
LARAAPSDSPARHADARRAFIVVGLLALVVRALVVGLHLDDLAWGADGIGLGAELGSIAHNIVEGRGFSSPFGPGSEPTAWIAPAVPWLWALFFQVFGAFTQASLIAVLSFQVLSGALACAVLAHIARRLIERIPGAPAHSSALCAGVLIFWPESLEQITKSLWYFPLQELVLAWMFLEGLRWLDQPVPRHAFRLSFTAGMLALVHPGGLPFFGVLLLIPLLKRQTHIAVPVAAGGLCLLIMLPWTLRNLTVMHAWIPVRSNFGVELLQGNGPRAALIQQRDSQHPAVDPVERERYLRLGEIEYMRLAQEEALACIRADLGRFALLSADRMQLYWLGDVLERWPWTPRPPWWENGVSAIFMRSLRIACMWAPALLLLWALISGAWRAVPSAGPLLALIVLLPLPYYFTHVQMAYSYAIRPYVILLVLLTLIASAARRRGRPPQATLATP